ncbi:MAG: hypothetical protein ABIE94_00005, partial [archaeon]
QKIQALESKLEEETRTFNVSASWQENRFIIENNLADLAVSGCVKGRGAEAYYPTDKVLYAEPGEEVSFTVSAIEDPSFIGWRDKTVRENPCAFSKWEIQGPMLEGAVYFDGHPETREEFQIRPMYSEPGMQRGEFGPTGYMKIVNVKVPEGMDDCTAPVVVELYSPKDPDAQPMLKFLNPNTAINREEISVVVGNPQIPVDLYSMDLGYTIYSAIMALGDHSTYKQNLSYSFAIPEVDFLKTGVSERPSISPPNVEQEMPATFLAAIQDSTGHVIGYACVPIHNKKYISKPREDTRNTWQKLWDDLKSPFVQEYVPLDIYSWEMRLPERGFSDSTQEEYKAFFERLHQETGQGAVGLVELTDADHQVVDD